MQEDAIAGGEKRRDRGRNALHHAISENDSPTAVELIESGDAQLLNQQTEVGITPLMLLAMGHCHETLLWRLLEKNGSIGASLRSKTRRTAADYAEEKESGCSAEIFKALRVIEASEHRVNAAARCPVCGDLLEKRSKWQYCWDRAHRGEEHNVSLQAFFNDASSRPLLQQRYHQLSCIRTIRKEISESLAMLDALQGCLSPLCDDSLHIVDLCCGRSVTSALLSLKRPSVHITAIDQLQPRFLPHFVCIGESAADHAAVPGGVHYVQLDVMDPSFVAELGKLISMCDRPTVLLGMHLCGQLSLRAIDAFKSLDAVRVIVLSPCCLPSKRDPASPSGIYASKDQAEQYKSWAHHLETTLKDATQEMNLHTETVKSILSPKNIVIRASKCGEWRR